MIKELIKNESVEAFNGIITRIENVEDHLSYITMARSDFSSDITIFPIYGKLSQEYKDKCVDVRIYKRGWINKEIQQKIFWISNTEQGISNVEVW